jgi:hypothetical protein
MLATKYDALPLVTPGSPYVSGLSAVRRAAHERPATFTAAGGSEYISFRDFPPQHSDTDTDTRGSSARIVTWLRIAHCTDIPCAHIADEDVVTYGLI